MNKLQKIAVGLVIASAVGVSYSLYTLRGLPDAFDWEEDEDE